MIQFFLEEIFNTLKKNWSIFTYEMVTSDNQFNFFILPIYYFVYILLKLQYVQLYFINVFLTEDLEICPHYTMYMYHI